MNDDPRSRRRLRTYESDDIVVTYDPRRCIHSAECVRGLRRVFDPDRVPWIDPELAEAHTIAEVIERCPTGALHYIRKDGGPAESPDNENVARLGPDGPVYVRGRIRIELPGGDDALEETRVAFCRCGASEDKPFCDGSHEEVGFRDRGAIQGGRLVPREELTNGSAEDAESGSNAGVVTFRGAPNGPLLVRGPLRVEGTDGSGSTGHKGALCRCGHASTRPFCDGSHRDTGFEAD